ncbi:hypothetical protein SDC9_164460 [bioreactor metagenome]|uniref:Uncharacterized protein n=1 Tax=bioreactor metagenome TaxID=1076179 RepID=A0A645FT67_9ZZZZ
MLFRLQLTHSVSRIGLGPILFHNRLVRFFVNRTKYTQRTNMYELCRNHLQFTKQINKPLGLPIIHPVKVRLMNTFGYTGTMNNIIKSAFLLLKQKKLFSELVRIIKIKRDKMQFLLFQIGLTACGSHTCPYRQAFFQSFFHNKTTDETARSCNQNILHQPILLIKTLTKININQIIGPFSPYFERKRQVLVQFRTIENNILFTLYKQVI